MPNTHSPAGRLVDPNNPPMTKSRPAASSLLACRTRLRGGKTRPVAFGGGSTGRVERISGHVAPFVAEQTEALHNTGASNTPKTGVAAPPASLASDFTAVLGRGARKQLARQAGVSPETVKDWFAGTWPVSRGRQLAELLIQNIERQERMLGEIKERALALAREDR
jgi:hypothetical protein